MKGSISLDTAYITNYLAQCRFKKPSAYDFISFAPKLIKRIAEQPFRRKSAKYLASFAMKKPETVKSYGIDRYDLTLGVVFVNGKNVIIEMVRNGLAEVYGEISAKGLSMNPYCVAGLRQKYRHWDVVFG